MTLRAILGTALLVTLTRPATWALALAGFLIRGGIVWFLLPILTLPTPVGLSNLFGPTVVDFVLGGPTIGVIALMLGGAVGIVSWIVGGGLAAAAIEVELIRIVAADDEVALPASEEPRAVIEDRPAPMDPPGVAAASPAAARPAGRILRVLAVRLIAVVPLMAALVFGTTRLIAVTYGELTLPSDIHTPIAWRVVLAVPDAIVIIVVTWLAGEIVGAWGTRRVVLGDPSIARALAGGIADAVRRPLETAGLFLLPSIVLALVLVPSALAASVAWTGLRSALTEAAGPLVVALALIAFVGLWIGGLALAGAVCAWRQAAWTVAGVRQQRGTFGGSVNGRPGDWKTAEPSATL